MGEVRRVRDVQLDRPVAMKIQHPHLLAKPSARARFLDEVQATARLQHPNIVPVHDAGILPDGRMWFTMKEVHGRTLADVAREVHTASGSRWEQGEGGWTFRRLITVFLSVCRAVVHAHRHRVLHRDLKPSNVMVGELGEVYVLDWGLAKLRRIAPDAPEESVASAPTDRTQAGRVVGTPAFMPPEQARGEDVDERSDIYALGAMLYQLLCGRAPFGGSSPSETLKQVLAGPPPPVASLRSPGPELPRELVVACETAMARRPGDRFGTAQALATEIEAWLDGARRRDQALALTERALHGAAEADAMVERARVLEAESAALLEGIEAWRPEEDKAPGWARAKVAEEARRAASLRQLEIDQELHAALRVAPGLHEAHAALAERYQRRHAEAEAARDAESAARSELLLLRHSGALPEHHPVRRTAATYLAGTGALTLVTDPPGAEVLLHRYVEHNRRLVPVFEKSLGRTPVVEAPVPMGSYLCLLRRDGRADVRYPIELPRLGHWDGRPPGSTDPAPIWLPPAGFLSSHECYVPAGWFRAGGDDEATGGFPARRLWCDALVVQTHPVTNEQFLEFLNDLVARGREDEALRVVPRDREGAIREAGSPFYLRTNTGGFAIEESDEEMAWQLDYPVVHVDWPAANAYYEWLATRTGRPWRLLGELEWEKAARGVDGRAYPWGDALDPSWCCMGMSHRGPKHPRRVTEFPLDESPFGVRGTAGNVRDWCTESTGPRDLERMAVGGRVVAPPDTRDLGLGLRAIRGGAWTTGPRFSRLANRLSGNPEFMLADIGVRGGFSPRIG